MLPGGRAVLFTSNDEDGAYDDAVLVIQPLPSGTRKVVLRGGHYGRYLPSGHLLFVRDATLFAAPFDLDRLETVGQPVPIIEGVASSAENGGAQFDVSASGTLVYLQQSTASLPLHWVDRDGKTTPLRTRLSPWLTPSFAPDGRRLALQLHEDQHDIYIYDWTEETLTRVTADPGDDRKPVWTPDGRRLAFSASRGDASADNVFWQSVDGTAEPQRLTTSTNPQQPASFHPSGKLLGLEELNPATGWDLMILPLNGDESSGWKAGVPTVFLATPFAEVLPMFSPDGNWIAYVSNETGQWEVYVRPYPGPGEKARVSNGGGMFPVWSRARRELLFSTPDSELLVAPYSTSAGSFQAARPVPWPQGRLVLRPGNRMFDVHPDGERIVLSPAALAPNAMYRRDRATFILNFADELRRTVPQKH
jgi:serine/threonine-protein kinase